MIIKLLLLFSLGFGANYYQPNLATNFSDLNIPDTLRLIGIMAQFPIEIPDNPKTSGDGNFLHLNHEMHIAKMEKKCRRIEEYFNESTII